MTGTVMTMMMMRTAIVMIIMNDIMMIVHMLPFWDNGIQYNVMMNHL